MLFTIKEIVITKVFYPPDRNRRTQPFTFFTRSSILTISPFRTCRSLPKYFEPCFLVEISVTRPPTLRLSGFETKIFRGESLLKTLLQYKKFTYLTLSRSLVTLEGLIQSSS